MQDNVRLLLIEDNSELAEALAYLLRQSNHIVDVVHTGKAAISACKSMIYGLIILDLGLPDLDGMQVLHQICERGISAPILILTARDNLQDRVSALDAGADDYLTKPFEYGELEARIRALLRRGRGHELRFSLGSIEFDSTSRDVSVHGQNINLTAREVAVLELLLQRAGRIVSKQQILDFLYADASATTNPAVVEIYVSRLRRKLKEADADVAIRVLRGLGYRLEIAGQPPAPSR